MHILYRKLGIYWMFKKRNLSKSLDCSLWRDLWAICETASRYASVADMSKNTFLNIVALQHCVNNIWKIRHWFASCKLFQLLPYDFNSTDAQIVLLKVKFSVTKQYMRNKPHKELRQQLLQLHNNFCKIRGYHGKELLWIHLESPCIVSTTSALIQKSLHMKRRGLALRCYFSSNWCLLKISQ